MSRAVGQLHKSSNAEAIPLENGFNVKRWLEAQAASNPTLSSALDLQTKTYKNQCFKWVHHILTQTIEEAKDAETVDGSAHVMDLCLALALNEIFKSKSRPETRDGTKPAQGRKFTILESIIFNSIPDSVAEILGNPRNWKSPKLMFEALKTSHIHHSVDRSPEAFDADCGVYAITLTDNMYLGKTLSFFKAAWLQHLPWMKLTQSEFKARKDERLKKYRLYQLACEKPSKNRFVVSVFANLSEYRDDVNGLDFLTVVIDWIFCVLLEMINNEFESGGCSTASDFARRCRPVEMPKTFHKEGLRKDAPLLKTTMLGEWTDGMEEILITANQIYPDDKNEQTRYARKALRRSGVPKTPEQIRTRRRRLGLEGNSLRPGDRRWTDEMCNILDAVIAEQPEENTAALAGILSRRLKRLPLDSHRSTHACEHQISRTRDTYRKATFSTIDGKNRGIRPAPRARTRPGEDHDFEESYSSSTDSEFQELEDADLLPPSQESPEDPEWQDKSDSEINDPQLRPRSRLPRRAKCSPPQQLVVDLISDDDIVIPNRSSKRRKVSKQPNGSPLKAEEQSSAKSTAQKKLEDPADDPYSDSFLMRLSAEDRDKFFDLKRQEIALKQQEIALELQVVRLRAMKETIKNE